jgi:hypothetical protein
MLIFALVLFSILAGVSLGISTFLLVKIHKPVPIPAPNSDLPPAINPDYQLKLLELGLKLISESVTTTVTTVSKELAASFASLNAPAPNLVATREKIVNFDDDSSVAMSAKGKLMADWTDELEPGDTLRPDVAMLPGFAGGSLHPLFGITGETEQPAKIVDDNLVATWR